MLFVQKGNHRISVLITLLGFAIKDTLIEGPFHSSSLCNLQNITKINVMMAISVFLNTFLTGTAMVPENKLI